MFLGVLMVPATTAQADSFDDSCGAPTIVDTGSNATHNLAATDVLFVDTGTYTGAINNFPSGAVICVDAGAVFQPAALNGSVAGSIYVRGTATFPGGGLSGGFLLDNYGSVSFPSGLNANGAITINNFSGAMLTANSPNWQGTLTNLGTVTFSNTFNENSGTIDNRSQLTIDGNANLNGDLVNSGRVDIQGALTVNTGDVDNSCTLTVSGDVALNPAGQSNSGHWLIAGGLIMNGPATMQLDGVLTMDTLTLDGDITGSGALRIENNSLQNGGSEVTGAPEINIYDVTRIPPPDFFDTQGGTVTNAVRVEIDVPDPDVPPASCAPEPPTPEADVSVIKSGPATTFVGQPVTYIVTVTNNGPDTAEGVLLHEAHDPSFTVTNVTVGGHLVGRSALWVAGDLVDGESVVFEVTGHFALTGTFADIVGASSGTGDPDPSNNEAELSTTVQNRPPDVEDMSVITNAFTSVSGQIEWSDPDAGQAVTFGADTIQLQALSPIEPDGSFTYTPSGTFAGREIFLALGCDDGVPELCEAAEIEVVVYPVAEDDSVALAAGSGVTIEIAVNDSGGTDPPTILSAPSGGTAVVEGSGFLYTSDPGFVGTDSFMYQICAPGEPDLCDGATVTIEVQQVATTTTTVPGSPSTTVDPTSSTTAVEGNLPLTGAELAILATLGLSAAGLGGVLVVSTRDWRRGRHRH